MYGNIIYIKINARSLFQIDQLTILFDDENNAVGIIIDFYVVFFKSVLTPDKLTKLFASLSVDQVGGGGGTSTAFQSGHLRLEHNVCYTYDRTLITACKSRDHNTL